LLCADGSVIKGCNVDNASIGGTICAERTAVVKAVSEGKKNIIAVAVTSDVIQPISPCGMCRQFLREFCEPHTPIFMHNRSGGYEVRTLELLLPMSFGPEALQPREALQAMGVKMS